MKRLLVHPLSSTCWGIFWDKYRRHRPFHAASWKQRLLAFPTIFVREPFYALERWIYGRRLAEQKIENSPIFIVGHWRSGTTHLHNLLSQDPHFAYLSFSNMTMPFDMLLGRYLPVIPYLMKLVLPRTRGIDQLPMSAQLPQEEELALGMLKGVSYYNCYFFPGHWDEYFA
ncbi:sulfotransferase, partial [Verrucomicrobiales bacterium]|nr:sulfotransferase [Verrucomicrobiales bacterium]